MRPGPAPGGKIVDKTVGKARMGRDRQPYPLPATTSPIAWSSIPIP
jgi:hypothetical protein